MENKNYYNISVDSCESCPSVAANFTMVPEEKLADMLYWAKKAFRQIEVTNSYTGEVAYSRYLSDGLFENERRYNYGEALDYMQHEFNK
mgnify:CR=1 FL=1